MAEVKNSFLKSKMNQDLDDRLIPNGEYRYANNISVGKSESDDIGTLQNILGNERLPLTDYNIPGLECIGTFMDNQNNRIFQFLTDYSDPIPSQITLPTTGTMMIAVYNLDSPLTYVTLVEGLFLNFAKNKEFTITGVNLVEGLLFWTDNRNQPRKINVSKAFNSPGYYTTEEQISVAKYAPVEAITLYKKLVATVTGVTGDTLITIDVKNQVVPGMTIISDTLSGEDYVTVVAADGFDVTIYEKIVPAISIGDKLTFLISTMTDQSNNAKWPGDPAFLESRYVRFSYRFKYDDNEYSLMAPFTQIAYIPKQKGYFIDGNETDAYRSTILSWFENNVNNIELIIPLPDIISRLTSTYKIQEIDILYKESDSNAVKVFETIPISVINIPDNASNNYYIQPYQSQKPYKTLAEDQTVRVYDKVPVRARAQESAGNRIIYGNYRDKYTSLSNINYNVAVQPKLTSGTNFIEYPNHTLKKNRNYQVGFVLADKFGRQSPVILSSTDLTGVSIGDNLFGKGSTIYSSYENSVLFTDVRTWFGDTLLLYLNSPITQEKNLAIGNPGLYAIPTNNSGFAITELISINPNEYEFNIDLTATASQYVPEVGDILRGKYVDYVKVLASIKAYQTPGDPQTPIVNVVVTTSDAISDTYAYSDPGSGLPDIKFSYSYNPVGWYSYKIVVKQQEQDYYNVYLPGILNGYPEEQTYGSQVNYDPAGLPSLATGINVTQFPVSETGNTSHIVLINDNINKVPRDLSEVGPDQKQYRSSVQLYGRVENFGDKIGLIGVEPQFSAKVTTISYSTLTAGNEDWVLVQPGDGIQCVEASTVVPDTTPPAQSGATKPNPYRWLKDTVVVSNVVTGTNGVITISVPNWVLKASTGVNLGYKNFTITRAENKQYFPTRKADTVISIASADEFNFLDNSEDNISGTSGLNFYQLQNKPLIGRISTVNDIGVLANGMIPFLGVYETKPDSSLLEIFWETATTGLISDLNTDVLTGFDGPAGFSNLNYTHFEWQNPNGEGGTEGAEDSAYITDKFTVLSPGGAALLNTTVTLTEVVDLTGADRTSDFEIVDLPNGEYRLKIKTSFTFNHNAPEKESYKFTFEVADLDSDPPTISILNIEGKLGNNYPIIAPVDTNYNITQITTNFLDLSAVNGSYYNPANTIPSTATTGLKWSIASGNTNPPSFGIDQETGVLSLINPEIPLGIYGLTIKVQDAVDTNTWTILEPDETVFGTLATSIVLNINIGDEPVPFWLRPTYESIEITPGTSCNPVTKSSYGMAYIGLRKSLGDGYLPTIPGSTGTYQTADNIEVKNASNYIPGEIDPSGLTEGEYRIKIGMQVPGPGLCNTEDGFATVMSKFKIYLYKRIYNTTSPGAWALSETENNKPTPYELGNLQVASFDGVPGQEKWMYTSFTIQADPIDIYEYAIGVEMTSELNNTSGNPPKVFFYGEDANYSYPIQTLAGFETPVTDDYSYYTGVETIANVVTGVPYETQDARNGISYTSDNLISFGSIPNNTVTFSLTLAAVNNQITPGLESTIMNGVTPIIGRIVNVNGVVVTIQLNNTYLGSTINLAAKNLKVNTFVSNLTTGRLYANTIEGTEIKRFYTDAAFTQKWIPPVPNRFYNFKTDKAYDPNNTGKYTKFPFYCAQFNLNGEVIEQLSTTPNAQTAWVGQNNDDTGQLPIANYSYNILYREP